MTDDQETRDVEELTAVLVDARPDVLIAGAMLQRVAVAAARRVLASEWLARRDDRIRREVAARVETDVLSGWQADAEDSTVEVVVAVEDALPAIRTALRGEA